MKEQEQVLTVELTTLKRAKNGDYINLYMYIDGCRFELVPHTRSKRELAYFYALLKRTKLASAD